MTKETVRMIRISSKPNLSVDFHVVDGQIAKIKLGLNETKGLIAQIHSPQPLSRIEELIQTWMKAYSQGTESDIELPVTLKGLPPYTYSVLVAMQRIPFGKTLSYRELAMKTGKPLGARAVGNACGRNPLPLIIPCHRVLASDGSIGGFSGGIEVKRQLLEFEGIML